jgi:hypothetical protein
VKDVAHDQDVGAWQVVDEEVAWVEAKAIAQVGVPDVVVEQGSDRRQVKAPAGQVIVLKRDSDRDTALRATDVDHGPRAIQGKEELIACAAPALTPVIALTKPRSLSGSE